ncbi:MAG: ABC transporter ATP-binding protein [candidate division WOR-3 bacterium]
MIIKLENIHASYGKKEILKGVDLQVNEHEIVSIIGPNGAGKSTLLKTIIGFLIPNEGKIIYKKKDITKLPTYKRSQLGIGYLFQGGSIFTNLTVMDNLLLALEQNNSKDLTNLKNLLILFPELNQHIKTRAGLLSGGLKQMLSLAMQLAKNPELLLLDEPSAGLAPSVVKRLINTIKQINQINKTTILLVEQNIRQALQISDRVYLMKNGKVILEEKDPLKLLSEESFEKIFFEK